jgi:diacylglycerol kinase (ATP)
MPHVHARVTTHPTEAFELASGAASKGFGRIIVAGGDGTINQVINGIGDSGIELGLVPLGTGNVLAHELGIPSNNIKRALEVIRDGHIRQIDLARAGDKRFILMAGFGFDAAVVESVSPKIKDVWGTMAYAPAIVEQLIKYAPTQFRLTLDDGAIIETEAFAVVVANCGTYAYNFKIAPEAVFDDGLLDVIVFTKGPGAAWRLIGQCLSTILQTDFASLTATCLTSASVLVESDPPVRSQIDGDVDGESGVRIEVLPKALRLLVPQQ